MTTHSNKLFFTADTHFGHWNLLPVSLDDIIADNKDPSNEKVGTEITERYQYDNA